MSRLTLQGQNRTERLLTRREQYFSGIDNLTDAEIEMLSVRWHAIANRYMIFIGKIIVWNYEANIKTLIDPGRGDNHGH